MVALDGLLALFEVGVQLFLLRESDAVDALEHLAVRVAAPVGGVAGGQLDGVALDPAGGVQMGAGAQIGELALLVEGDVGVLRQIMDQLHLVGLALLLHELDGLFPGQLEPLQLQLLLADLPHLCLDLLQVLRREGEGGVQVVVPALVDGGADGQLHLGPQALDGLRHDVRAGVPVGLAVLGIFKRELVLFADLDFFRHVIYLHFHLRVQKSSTPDVLRGEAFNYSTVPPCLHSKTKFVSLCKQGKKLLRSLLIEIMQDTFPRFLAHILPSRQRKSFCALCRSCPL